MITVIVVENVLYLQYARMYMHMYAQTHVHNVKCMYVLYTCSYINPPFPDLKAGHPVPKYMFCVCCALCTLVYTYSSD